jgi:porin-like protein
MKMVKSLLLGSAAGLVAVTAGQAADLPVKAKPVEYVKVCTLYGAGFYYIPGTDVCLKLGGFVRTEIDVHAAGSFAVFTNGANAFQTRAEDNYITRARAYITTDVREQTSYGTLRGYIAAGWQYSTDDAPTISLPGTQSTGTTTHAGAGISTTFTGGGNSNVSLLRAFIQFGGFTFGKTASFYDFFNTSKYSLQTNFLYQDYAGVGVFTYGYTQQLGNGVAATIAFQDPSPFENNIVDLNPPAPSGPFGAKASSGATTVNLGTTSNVFVPGSANNIQNAGTLVPDIVAAVRVDQAWGGAQVATILHDNRALYYNNTFGGTIKGSDHPSDKWGWAVMGGLELNTPFFGQGDSFAIQGQYCVGESYSCYNRSGTRFNDVGWNLVNVNRMGLGWVDDAFYASPAAGVAASGLELSTNWNVWAAFQHYWTPALRTSLYGGYAEFKANSTQVNNLVCAPLNAGVAAGGLPAQVPGAVAATGCLDWAAWAIGSRTLWNPVKNLDVGVDVLYTSMAKSAFAGATVAGPAAGTATVMTVGDTHIWAGILRVQYNFYP